LVVALQVLFFVLTPTAFFSESIGALPPAREDQAKQTARIQRNATSRRRRRFEKAVMAKGDYSAVVGLTRVTTLSDVASRSRRCKFAVTGEFCSGQLLGGVEFEAALDAHVGNHFEVSQKFSKVDR
jgi:hypothetical protein